MPNNPDHSSRLRRCLRAGVVAAGLLLVAGCRDDDAGAGGPRRLPRPDVDELQRIKDTPLVCAAGQDCPTGSYCDAETAQCDWDCLGDSDCDDGQICSADGVCIVGVSARANDETICTNRPVAERRAALIALAEAEDPPGCNDHDDCPCGAYCDREAGSICRVDCLPDGLTPPAPPALDLVCSTGLACSPLGQCTSTPPPPPPTLNFTVATTPMAITANTLAGPVVREVSIQLVTDDLVMLSPQHAARVRVVAAGGFAPGDPRPRVKCAATAPLADDCVLDGGWIWDINTGDLRSRPRTVWIEIPQADEEASWTIEARSQWAGLPGLVAATAEPVELYEDDPGYYSGTLTVANGGAGTADNANLVVPIEALVTQDQVVLTDPTRVLWPAGPLVFDRWPNHVVMVPWLSAAVNGGTQYLVRFKLGALTFDVPSGHLAGTISLTTGDGNGPRVMALSLDRTRLLLDITPCSSDAACASGSYCDGELDACLAGPRLGSFIVEETSAEAQPSKTLPSAQVVAWAPTLPGLVSGSSGTLGGGGITGVERAYCHRSSAQAGGAARFGVTPDRVAGPEDLKCRPGLGEDYPQTTFGIANLDKELDPNAQGGAFDLFQSCVADLNAAPGSNPLGARPCVSLARFFLALEANNSDGVGQPLALAGQRLVNQLLRQWLSVNSYVASTAVRLREYDDVLGVSTQPAHVRLGSALDLMESGLRVMLDPRVRGQYRSGPDIALATHSPDYRNLWRPFARWSFTSATMPLPNSEGSGGTMTYRADRSNSRLLCNKGAGSGGWNPAGQATTSIVRFGDQLVDDSRFSIVMAARFGSYPRNGVDTFKLFEKSAANGERLWVEARNNAPGTPSSSLSLTLKDSAGGIVTFPALAGDADGEWGFVAIVADGGTYRLYQVRAGLPAVTVSGQIAGGGGVRWGADGTLRLECALPISSSCFSWHRYHPGDYLGGVDYSSWQETQPALVYSVTYPEHSSPGAPDASFCVADAAARRNALLSAIATAPPPGAANGLTVTANTPVVVAESHWWTGEPPVFEQFVTYDYICSFSVAQFPKPPAGARPVCGAPGTGVRTGAGIYYDEISLWNRALSIEEFTTMAARYANNPVNESLPPPSSTPLPNTEQATALPAHLLEAAGDDVALLSEYIRAERDVLFAECHAGGPSPARDRVLDRAGRNLRLVALLEGEAVHLAELPDVATAAWYPRYTAARRQLAGRRTEALQEVTRALECKNTLGITEEDIPLFTGQAVGANDKFYASTRYLTSRAAEEVAAANTKLQDARTNYVLQRQSQFQVDLEGNLKAQRLAGLADEYEGALRRVCGAPPMLQKLLPGFLAGTLQARNCFFKAETTGCAGYAGAAVADVPASCLRGELGNQVLAIQAAAIDVQSATKAVDRAQQAYDLQVEHCIRMADFNHDTTEIGIRHQTHMKELRRQRQRLAFHQKILSLDLASLSNMFTGPLTIYQLGLQDELRLLGNDAEDAEAAYQRVLAAREGEQAVMACYHTADLQKFSIDTARDVVVRASHTAATALGNLENDKEVLRAVVDQAAGQIALEERLVRAPPQFHYWLNSHIEQFQRHMKHARRLTYLAVRAFEYESMADPNPALRSLVLAAHLPADLTVVLTELNSHTAPIGQSVRARPVVLSLRDELLRLQPISGPPDVPGGPPLTPEQKLQRYLLSDSALIYDEHHNLLGRGIRFAVTPAGFSDTSCAERIWRVTTSPQMNNQINHHSLVLYQSNTFASQQCRAPVRGTLRLTRSQPSNNLLLGEVAILPFVAPLPHGSINVDGPFGMSRSALMALPEDGHPAGFAPGFAGRGLYGDYILLFPKGDFPPGAITDNLSDVLIRFDMVEGTNASLTQTGLPGPSESME